MLVLGQPPRSIAVANDRRVWVSNKGSSTISIIDPLSLSVVQTISLSHGSQPFGLVFDPQSGDGFVVLEGLGQLVRINASTGEIISNTPIGANPRHLSISGDGAKILVSRFITPPVANEHTANPNVVGAGGEILVINPSTMTILSTAILQVSDKVDSEHNGRGLPNYLRAPVISPGGVSAWVPSKQDNIQRGTLRDGFNLGHDSTIRAITSRIDLTNNSEDYFSRIDHNDAAVPTRRLSEN